MVSLGEENANRSPFLSGSNSLDDIELGKYLV